MKILVACEESQTVAKAFRNLGHDAYSCDIMECSGGHPEWHIQGDVICLLNGYCTFTTMTGATHTLPSTWDMIIAFPPCTYLSKAGSTILYPTLGNINIERYQKGLLAREFLMTILNANCPRIAIENPTPNKVYNLPPPSQVIQPWHFGDPNTKRTLIWLKGLPPLFATDLIIPKHSCNAKNPNWNTGRKNRAVLRSKTFDGIANAMASQWGRYKGGEQ